MVLVKFIIDFFMIVLADVSGFSLFLPWDQ